jgi:hypothetical protein
VTVTRRRRFARTWNRHRRSPSPPLPHRLGEHVNLTGDYTWQATGRLRKGAFTRRTALDCMPRPPHLPFGGVGRCVPLSTRFMARLRTLQAPYLLRLPSFPASASVERPKAIRVTPESRATRTLLPVLRPKLPYGHGALDLAIETAFIKWQGWIAPGGRIIVHLECRQWQHNIAFSGSIPLQPALSNPGLSVSHFSSHPEDCVHALIF